MKVVFTKHASVDKTAMLKKHKFAVSIKSIKNIIKNPEDEDKESDYPKIIASGSIDEKHILRVVYKRRGDIITVTTFYPATKGRYY